MKHALFLIGLVALFTGATLVTGAPGRGHVENGSEVAPLENPFLPAPRLPPPTGPQPRIVFVERTIDFGAVPHGTVVRRAFAFRNDGPGELELIGIRTSCGCTAALPSKRRLKTGESAEITVAFDTSRKPGVKERARHENHVFVTTNDRLEKDAGVGVTRLSLAGEVISRYRVTPETGAMLRPFQKGAAQPVEVTVTLAPLGNAAPLSEATEVAVSAPSVRIVGPRPSAKAGAGAIELVVTPDPAARVGQIDATITVKTGDAAQPEVRIPVRGHVLPPVQVTPPRLVASTDQPPRPITLSAQFPLRVLGVDVVPDDGGAPPFIATGAPAEAKNKVVITLAAAENGAARGGTGEVRVLLADGETPIVVVPYVIRDSKAIRSELEAHRRAGIRVSPPELFLGELRPGQEVEQSIVVSRAGGPELAVEALEVEPRGALEARVEPITGGAAARVIVRAKASLPGAIAGVVRFRPRPEADPVAVRVSGRIAVPCVATPAAFYVGGPEGASVVLGRPDGKPLRIAGARDTTGALEVASEGTRVTVRPRPGAKGPIRGAVSIAIDDPAAGALEIPAFGEVN